MREKLKKNTKKKINIVREKKIMRTTSWKKKQIPNDRGKKLEVSPCARFYYPYFKEKKENNVKFRKLEMFIKLQANIFFAEGH